MPTTASPNRQSRAPTHITAAYSSASTPPHHSTGVPSSSTWRRQSLPAGASQPWVPGLMSTSAATPTGRFSSSQPGRLRGVGVGAVVEEVGVEHVDVAVVVPQRPQRLGHLAEPAGVRLVAGRPVLAAGVVGVLRGGEVLLVLLGVDQPAGPGGDVDDQARPAPGARTPGCRRPAPTSAPTSARRTSAGRPRSTARPAGRRPRAGSRLPLAAQRQPPAHPADQQPRPEQQPAHRPPAAAGDRVGREPGHPGAVPVAVVDAGRRRRRAGRTPRRCRAAPAATARSCRPSKLSSSPATQPSAVEPVSRRASRHITSTISDADHGGGDAPAERVHPEGLLAERDQPLADLGVDDHRRGVLPDARGGAVEDLLVRRCRRTPARSRSGPATTRPWRSRSRRTRTRAACRGATAAGRSASRATPMLADQPTTGSSSRTRPRARTRASGTGRPEPRCGRGPPVLDRRRREARTVVTVADSTGPPERVRTPAMIGA